MSLEGPHKPKSEKAELTPEDLDLIRRVEAGAASSELAGEKEASTAAPEAPVHTVLDAHEQKARRDAAANPHGFRELDT